MWGFPALQREKYFLGDFTKCRSLQPEKSSEIFSYFGPQQRMTLSGILHITKATTFSYIDTAVMIIMEAEVCLFDSERLRPKRL